MQTLVIGGGCFWGMEELFRMRPGVVDTEVGYCGGINDNPTYYSHSGHAEALQISYEDTTIGELLDYFFRIHDPTTKNRQGNDIGTSYRSTIFYADGTQYDAGLLAIKRNQAHWKKPIVTTLEPLETFWPAESEHQDFLQHNPGGYTCHYERDF